MSAAINVHASNIEPAHTSSVEQLQQEQRQYDNGDKPPEQIRKEYEELRARTEPTEAMIDPSLHFEHPEVSVAEVLTQWQHVSRGTQAGLRLLDAVCAAV